MAEEPRPPTAAEVLSGVAEELARYYPPIWRGLLAEHLPDESGHCSVCTSVPYGRPVWPCTLWSVASRAQWLSQSLPRSQGQRRAIAGLDAEPLG